VIVGPLVIGRSCTLHPWTGSMRPHQSTLTSNFVGLVALQPSPDMVTLKLPDAQPRVLQLRLLPDQNQSPLSPLALRPVMLLEPCSTVIDKQPGFEPDPTNLTLVIWHSPRSSVPVSQVQVEPVIKVSAFDSVRFSHPPVGTSSVGSSSSSPPAFPSPQEFKVMFMTAATAANAANKRTVLSLVVMALRF
jgi:hypothetical protein